jgi:hypothetical protein
VAASAATPQLPLYIPLQNCPQLQMQMEVAGRKSNDFNSFWRANGFEPARRLPLYNFFQPVTSEKSILDLLAGYAGMPTGAFLQGQFFSTRTFHNPAWCREMIEAVLRYVDCVENDVPPVAPKAPPTAWIRMVPQFRIEWVSHAEAEPPPWEDLFPTLPARDRALDARAALLLAGAERHSLTRPWKGEYLTVFLTRFATAKSLVSDRGVPVHKFPL